MKLTRKWTAASPPSRRAARARRRLRCRSDSSLVARARQRRRATAHGRRRTRRPRSAPPKKASGSPIVVGLLNLESGPGHLPRVPPGRRGRGQVHQRLQGRHRRPSGPARSCATDGQPSTSARCAGQIADKKPAFILGGADTGAPGAFAVWKRTDLAYLGGIPFTPVESNAPNAVQFISSRSATTPRRRSTRPRSSASRRRRSSTPTTPRASPPALGVIAAGAQEAGRRGQDGAGRARRGGLLVGRPRRRSRTRPTWSTSTRRTRARAS